MRKIVRFTGICCANCAAKMERNILKIKGVISANVNFLTQKLTIEADDNNFESIMDEVVKVCKAVEPDCEIVR